jgi:hypothetical protein
MSDVVDQPPPDAVLRFRMRTMIAVTSVLAVLAAMAGPYYRSVDSEAGRRGLLILWSFSVLGSGVSFWMRVKESWRVPINCHFRYLVYARGKYRRGVWSTLWTILLCLLLAGAIAVYSHTTAIGPPTGAFTPRLTGKFFSSPVFQGMLVGSWTAALIFSFVRRPMFLCEEGVPLGKVTLAPWKYIRHAEWLTDRPETLKLHRLDGDIYLDVPNDVRAEVEAFVRGKTQFLDDLPRSPRFEEPGAEVGRV